ncbi:S-layer homology domain-containing protein [Alkalihalophilus marmarensis]|uniref:S-layer homology domain-containing protein n=1 Tax=Alkalihalophilus marmarensis TaxID=521377 RepID=UPI002DBF08DE|nr:S-layer homology domain-containing protein [Alkalihalophilus marmarensis]MEC2071355.1 S-layer homology domain-containing protein [Alkalihalophilus marmarensis]
MKRYPFSKKAVSIMLATALAVTPIASTLPVGGEVQAASVNIDQEIRDLSTSAFAFYNGVTGVNVNVTSVSINQYPSGLSEDQKQAFNRIVTQIADITYSNYANAAQLETAIQKFRDERRNDFKTVFGTEVVADEVISFTRALVNKLKSDSFLISVMDKSVKEAVRTAVNQEKSKFTSLEGALSAIGTSLEDMIDLILDVNDNIDSDKSKRSKLLSNFVKDKFTFVKPSGTLTAGGKISISLNASFAGINPDVSKANVLEWYYNGRKVDPKDITLIEGANTLEAKLKETGSSSLYTIFSTSLVASPSSPGGGGPITDPDPDPVDPDPVDPDPVDPIPPRPGQTVDAGDSIVVERETTETGQVKAVTKVDGSKLAEVISAAPAADRVSLRVERAEGEVAELRLPKAAVEALEGAANKNLVVDIDTDSGSVTIPVKELAAEKVRGMLDVPADADFEISVFVNPASPQEVAAVTATLESDARGLKAKSEIVDFSMIVRSGDKSQNVTRFSSYIHRELPVTDVTSPQNLVVYNVDAAPVAVPTQAGSDRVRFSSYEFSKYVVVEREPVAFPDLAANHWAKNAINTLSVRDILVGFENGEVRPARQTTRAEFAAIVTRALALPSAGEYSSNFSDVKGTEWFAKDLIPVVEAGIVHGRANGTFDPNAPITRQEAAAMVARATHFIELDEDKFDESVKVNQFTDANTIAPWAKSDVELAVQAGIIVGHANGTFDARGNTNRAQVASMINLLLEKADLK